MKGVGRGCGGKSHIQAWRKTQRGRRGRRIRAACSFVSNVKLLRNQEANWDIKVTRDIPFSVALDATQGCRHGGGNWTTKFRPADQACVVLPSLVVGAADMRRQNDGLQIGRRRRDVCERMDASISEIVKVVRR